MDDGATPQAVYTVELLRIEINLVESQDMPYSSNI